MSKNLENVENEKNFFVRWTSYFIDKWRVSIIFLIALLIAGFFGVTSNQRQDFPEIPGNYIQITATYPGASSDNIEKQVIMPVEQAISGVDDIESVRANVSDNFGFVMVEMDTFDSDELAKRASQMSDEIAKAGLPNDAEVESKVLDIMGPSMGLALVSENGHTTNDLLEYATDIKSRIASASDDIKKVEVMPSDQFKVNIKLDKQKLTQAGLSYDMVKNVVQAYTASLPGGSLETTDGFDKAIVINAPAQTITDIEEIAFGPNLTLSDIAEIKREPLNAESIVFAGYTKDDQVFSKEAVYILIYKKGNGDIITISDAVMEEVEDIKAEGKIPADTDLINIYDTAPEVQRQIDDLLRNAALGVALILVVLLFFINFRAAVVAATILPLVFLATLFTIWGLGYTINILTLFGMILALGVLVDNAIVITEGMAYELERGATRREAALRAVKKFAPAVTSATLTTLVVFFVFGFGFGGIMGQFLKYIPFTVVVMMIASYFLAISIIPLFGTWILKEESESKKTELKKWQKYLIIPAIVYYGQKWIDKAANGYKSAMKVIYKNVALKVGLFIASIALIGGGLSMATQLEGSQMPETDSNIITVNYDYPAGTSFETKKAVNEDSLEKIVEIPYFENYIFMEGSVYITITDPGERQDDDTDVYEIADNLNETLKEVETGYDGVDIKASAASYGPPGSDYDVVIEILDEDIDVLKNVAAQLTAHVESKDGVKRVLNGYEDKLVSSLQVEFDEQKLNQLGVNSFEASQKIGEVFSRQELPTSITVREDGVADDIYISYNDESTNSIEDLESLVVSENGVTLNQVAEVKEVQKLENISRLDGQKVIPINIMLEDSDDSAKVQKDIEEEFFGLERDARGNLTIKDEAKLKALGLENEESVSFGGFAADFENDMSRLAFVGVLGLVLVYIILVNQFNSYVRPALIMLTVVAAFAGVFPGLWIFGETLNTISGLGIVALIGIAVNDAIVFMDTLAKLRKENPNRSLAEVVSEAGFQRFKPIFSTTITTILGILPLAIADPFWRGLGISIAAGLIFSTLGTLFIVPITYTLFSKFWGKGVLGLCDKVFKTKHKCKYMKHIQGTKK